MPAYLRPTAPIAESAILPGDPKRAMDLASALVVKPLMSNLARGLWGYHGETASGEALTVQSTGIGGPSAALVVADLGGLGVRRALRVGTCAALSELEPGTPIVVGAAIAADGTGRSLGGETPIGADPTITAALSAAFESEAMTVVSVDLPGPADAVTEAMSEGAVAVDLSTAAVLASGARAGVACGAVLVVHESAQGALSDDELDAATLAAGRLAASALVPVAQA